MKTHLTGVLENKKREMTVYLTMICLLFCVSGVRGEGTPVSAMEGDSVTLNTGVTKQQHDTVLWFFNNTRIALINRDPNTSCLYDGEGGRFRDRLKVDYESGSLTITDIRSEHTGGYEAELIRSESSGKRQSLNRNRKCDSTKIFRKNSSIHNDTIKIFSVTFTAKQKQSDRERVKQVPEKSKAVPGSGLSGGVIAGIVVVVLLLVFGAAVAGVIYYRRRSSKKANNNEVL